MRQKHDSDNAQPRTNQIGTGKRAPEAVRAGKTGRHRVTLQRQPISPPKNPPFCVVDITVSTIDFHHKITTTRKRMIRPFE